MSEELERELVARVRARNVFIWVTSPEEPRVEASITAAAVAMGFTSVLWDVVDGLSVPLGAEAQFSMKNDKGGTIKVEGRTVNNPSQVLELLAQRAEGNMLWVLRDFEPFLQNPVILRSIKNLARKLPMLPAGWPFLQVVFLSSIEMPTALQGSVTGMVWPTPDRAELAAILDGMVARTLPLMPGAKADQLAASAAGRNREAAVDAALGLTAVEAKGAFARSIVDNAVIDARAVHRTKKSLVRGLAGLKFIDPEPGGLDAIGGLGNLKTWILRRARVRTPEARAAGLPLPKGIMLFGHSGTGKSLTAKCVATALQLPLLALSLGDVLNKYVGDTESNLKRALAFVVKVGGVLWIDEIEKAIAGSGGGGDADGGIAKRILGIVLSWMQEEAEGVFIVATANDISGLPPELLRKGRFDEIFFVDLPSRSERADVLRVVLKKYDKANLGIDIDAVVDATDGYVGAEIDALLPASMFLAFEAGRPVNTQDLLDSAAASPPLSRLMVDKTAALRRWADGRAMRANTIDVDATSNAAPDGVLLIS